MNKVIWKTELTVADHQAIQAPEGSEVLSAQLQQGALCIWYLCDPDATLNVMDVWILGTGHTHDSQGDYVDTFQTNGGSLVFHVFAEMRDRN